MRVNRHPVGDVFEAATDASAAKSYAIGGCTAYLWPSPHYIDYRALDSGSILGADLVPGPVSLLPPQE